ncbi:MAG: HhH-GPD-type base excision DNA repair protein [Chloroflexota bacterium]
MKTMLERLPYTGIDGADRLLAREPLALLIGLALDQQVTLQKAFSGPWDLSQRLGHLDAARIAAMDPAELDEVFRRRPALHRFPGSMAGKVQALCTVVRDEYANDPASLWTEARDGRDLEQRIGGLPGFGPMKVRTLLAILYKRFGLELPGLADVVPDYPTLADADSPEALARYQEMKRAHKAELKAKSDTFQA